MKVVFKSGPETVGVVTLEGDTAVPDERIKPLLDDHFVPKPGDPERELSYKDGAVYLSALPAAFSGSYLRATLQRS